MRVALISLAGNWPAIAGKPLAERQAEFAIAARAERIVALGDGAAPQAIALRHAVERAGAKFQAIGDCRGVLGAARADDDLLVLAPGLLPDADAAIALVERAPAVLVLPAAAGAAAGFERIDLERTWGGALAIPGAWAEKLAGLPAETEAAAALLRVALQAGAKERAVPEALLADGSWAMVREDADGDTLSRGWLARHVLPASRFSASGRLGEAIVRHAGLPLLSAGNATMALQGGGWGALAVGAAIAGLGHPTIGFAVIAAAVVAATLGSQLRRLQATWKADLTAVTAWLADAALVAAAAGAVEGTWPHRLFPPLVLVGALRSGRVADPAQAASLAGDRALLALVLAVAASLGLTEPAVMLLALLAIALNLPKIAPSSG